MRCEVCELRHGQSRRGKQHDAKFCHDVLDPRKNLAARLAGKKVAFAERFGGSING
jgi:hypothetical protein